MVRFKVGQTVKFIGRNGLFSPLNGDVGVVLKKNYWNTEYLVSFPWVEFPKSMDCKTKLFLSFFVSKETWDKLWESSERCL